jgi:gamma-glutamyl hydrolase
MKSDPRFEGYTSYMMNSYVHFAEAAGARVVPLILGEPKEVTLDKLSKLNGVLFPGGDGTYYDFGKFIYDTVKDYND